MGKKKETQGLLDQKTRLIGIAAAGHSVGCTHFSIMLLNYLAGYRRRRAALMEWNSTGDLERLEKVCTGMVRESSAYRVLEADYFKHAGPRELAMADVYKRQGMWRRHLFPCSFPETIRF